MFFYCIKNKLNLKTKFIILMVIVLILTSGLLFPSFGIQHYQKVDFVTGFVTADILNVRSGPSTSYNVITKVYKNEYIRIFARVGNWYVIQTDKDFIGAVSVNYIKPIYSSNNSDNNQTNTNQTSNTELTKDEKETFNLINEQRVAAGLPALIIDNELQNVARIKANDMVQNGYFSHTSPIYGSPFEMMKNFKITYKTAGENIAGNSTNAGAVNAWMNSAGHKANILNSSYNYTGLAVVSSPKYGKIYVQMFIGR